MGVGLVILTSNPVSLIKFLKKRNEQFWDLGLVDNGTGEVVINSNKQNILIN